MAFNWTVKIIRASGTVTKRFTDFNHDKGQFNRLWQVRDCVLAAIKMPKTIRVEVQEEDTQLYGYPSNDRSYPMATVLKDGRAYKFHGKNANAAFLHNGPLHSFTNC